jgi:hypothetical protein
MEKTQEGHDADDDNEYIVFTYCLLVWQWTTLAYNQVSIEVAR